MRQCGRGLPPPRPLPRRQGADAGRAERAFRHSATRAGITFNPAFAGAYNFSKKPDFGELFERFLDALPEGGLIMCHPGFVDDI